MITGMAHVCIGTADLRATEDFYCNVLGFERHFAFIRNGEECGFYLALPDGSFIEVFEQESTPEAANPPIKHICLEVADMDGFIDRARAQGVEVSDKSLGGDRSWQAWLTDPSGVRIELHQYTPESSQNTRVDCVLD
ncbi:MAG: VOC family protein [Nitrospiraceae bacterium]|nr:VOC family protein [Nitrospiraceae bacterium]